MNTHEHFRNSRSRTFFACHFYCRLFFSIRFWKRNANNSHWSILYIFFPQKYLLIPSELIFELEMSDWLTVWIDSIDALWWIDLYNCETQVSKRCRKFWTWWACLVAFRYLKYFKSKERFLFPGRRSLESGTLNSNSLQFRNTGLFSIIGISGDSCSSARHDKKTRLILILPIRDPRKKNTKYKDGLKIENCYLYKLLKIFLFFQRI